MADATRRKSPSCPFCTEPGPLDRATGLRHDSRRIEPGDAFVALAGAHHDGARFVAEAVARGATVVLAEGALDARVPVVRVEHARVALAHAAAHVYGHPALPVVGITGTNGKTTTSSMLAAALEATGHAPAVLGTLGLKAPHGESIPMGSLNTPEADSLARTMVSLAPVASHLLMEATSHAIAEHRLDGIQMELAAFTNFSHDHLDLHGTLEAYAAAKRRLFDALAPRTSVVMIDDTLGREIAKAVNALTVSSADLAADVVATEVELDAAGARCVAETPRGRAVLRSRQLGHHNLSNMLLALGMALGLGLDLETAARAIGQTPAVRGRMQRIAGEEIAAFVDYAHTPVALGHALRTARLLTEGRVICVFGCGGDRDPSKRAPMGDTAEALADLVFVTSDNPRSESPAEIAAEITRGAKSAQVELDRRRAIERAVEAADPGDVLLVAGKGHETTQVGAAGTVPFDDAEVLRDLLSRRAAAAASD